MFSKRNLLNYINFLLQETNKMKSSTTLFQIQDIIIQLVYHMKITAEDGVVLNFMYRMYIYCCGIINWFDLNFYY